MKRKNEAVQDRVKRIRKHLTNPKITDDEIIKGEIIKGLDIKNANIPASIPQMATGPVLPVGVLLNETKQKKEDARHKEILDAIANLSNHSAAQVGTAQPVNTIADNQGGTITYRRNEQGQTIITGGTVNPGYYAELGQGAAIKPESQIRLNHTTGNFQPGLYPPEVEKPEKKSAKPRKVKKYIKPAYRRVLVWELIAPEIEHDPSLRNNLHNLREWLLRNADEDLSKLKDDTLREIIKQGDAEEIPTREEFERKNNM